MIDHSFYSDADLAQMNEGALERYVAELDGDIEVLRGAKRTAARFLEKRALAEAMRRKIENLSDTERAELKQALNVPGIASAEVVTAI